MHYGKVLFGDFDFDDDTQGVVRISLSTNVFERLVARHPNDVSIVRYGDIYYQPIDSVAVSLIQSANLFFRVNFETNDLRVCAEVTCNTPHPPMFFSDYHMHSNVIEPNIMKRGFSVAETTPDILPFTHEHIQLFAEKNEFFKERIPKSDFKRIFTINVKRHLCSGFDRPMLIDECVVVTPEKKMETFREAIFFGDSMADMESEIYVLRQLMGDVEFASMSRFETAQFVLDSSEDID
jgi:hypothetical protein